MLNNAEPIQSTFKEIRDHLTPELASALTPMAYIEAHYLPVQAAKRRIADRQAQQEIKSKIQNNRLKAKALKDHITVLKQVPSRLEQEVKNLEPEKDQLIQQVNQINTSMATIKIQLAAHPAILEEKKKELTSLVRAGVESRQRLQAIPGADEEDQRIIADVEAIRQRAVTAVEKALSEYNPVL